MTTIDWRAAGIDDPTAGRRTIRERLEAGGLAFATADYHRAYEEFRRGQAAGLAARRAEAEERERRRIEPYMAEARAFVAEQEIEADEIDAAVVEQATALADEAEEAAEAAARAAEREAAEQEDYRRRVAATTAASRAAEAAVEAAGWTMTYRHGSADGSCYYWVADPTDEDGERFSLRISDHVAPGGGGWSDERQERHSAPDINIVIRLGAGGDYTFDLAPLVETLDR